MPQRPFVVATGSSRTGPDLSGPAVGVLLLGIALLASACGDGAPVPDEPLRLGFYSDPLSLDPHFKNEVQTFSILSHVYEGLTRIDRRGRVKPALAERWENPDDVRWHFVLREDVSFHDGRPLRAADVVASLERAHRHPKSNMSSYVVEIDNVRAIDERTVEIVTTRPYPILLNKLAFVAVVPRDAPEEIGHPVGTGPYRFLGWEPGEGVELEAHDGWWRPAPDFERVQIRTVGDDEERLERLFAGELDLVLEVPPASAERFEEHECCELVAQTGLQTEYLGMRPTAPPFDDPRVREAVHVALDREALVDEVLHGFGTAGVQMVSVHVFGHDSSVPVPPGDPELARELLADAGHPDGVGVVLEAREGRDPEPIAEQLRRAGFRVETRTTPWPELYRRLQAQEIDFYYGGMLAVSADSSDVFDSVAHSLDPSSGYGQNNSMGYENARLDLLVEESSTALDMFERRDMLQQAMRLLVADRVYLGLFSPQELFGIRDGLEWTPRVDGFVYAWEVSPSPRE